MLRKACYWSSRSCKLRESEDADVDQQRSAWGNVNERLTRIPSSGSLKSHLPLGYIECGIYAQLIWDLVPWQVTALVTGIRCFAPARPPRMCYINYSRNNTGERRNKYPVSSRHTCCELENKWKLSWRVHGPQLDCTSYESFRHNAESEISN